MNRRLLPRVLIICVWVNTLIESSPQRNGIPKQGRGVETSSETSKATVVNDMEVSIYLFNLDRYSRVVEPAINSYVAQSDPGPVLKLIDQIRASEVPLIEHPRSWPMFKAGAFLGIESVLT